nr:DeoR/GlpR family DNA-binding transcription regulator [Pseudactinotalea sp. HY160]
MHVEHCCGGIEHVQRANRLKTIMTAVRSPAGVRVSDLVAATGASAMTIRRDLGELERQGVLRRVHGGAVSLPARGARPPFALRLESQVGLKQAIARAAAELVPDGSSIIVDAGTTAAAVAGALAGRDVTALVLSVPAAAAAGERPGARIITPGGPLDGDDLTWFGHRAVQDVLDFRADLAILGVCAWDEHSGLTSTSTQDAETKRAMLASARRTIAVATPDKLNTSATFTVSPSGSVDALITGALPAETRAWITAAGVDVVEAGEAGAPV